MELSPLYIEESTSSSYHQKNKLFRPIENLSFTFTHVLVFSIFESIFYWTYIVPRENHALLIQLSYIKSAVETVCINIPDTISLDLTPLLNEASDEREEQIIQGPLRATIYINLILFFNSFLFVFLATGCQEEQENSRCIHICLAYKKALKECALTLTVMILYEVLFFEMVVSNYNPGSVLETGLMMSDACFE